MPDGVRPLALVTGASGFIGAHVVEALLRRRWRVRCLVRRTSSTRWLPVDRVELAHGDVAETGSGATESLAAALRETAVVFHLAALTSAVRDDEYTRVNVQGTRNVADLIVHTHPAALLVLCSSLAAAGPSRRGRSARETDPPRPVSAYGRSKLAAEGVLAGSAVRHVIVRPPAVYGPREADILAGFRLARRGLAMRLAPRGQELSMVHARDLAEGLVLAAEREASGMYYMSDGEVHTWEEVVAGLGAAVGRRPRVVPVPRPMVALAAVADRTRARLMGRKPLLTPDRARELAQEAWTCDDSRARRELGYSSSIPLAAGLRETAEWYRAQGWL